MCDQACSRDSVFICRRDMSQEEQESEQVCLSQNGYQECFKAALRDMSALALRIAADVDNSETCEKIKKSLIKVIYPILMLDLPRSFIESNLLQVLAVRVKNCGDAARCTCEDSLSDAASLSCGINCEQLVNLEQRNQRSSSNIFSLLSVPMLLSFHYFL